MNKLDLQRTSAAAKNGSADPFDPAFAQRSRRPATLPVSRSLPLDTVSSVSSLYDVQAFGADPHGITPGTDAIQSAIDACADAGGGVVWIPAGRFLTGALWLKSNVTLHLVSGARLVGSTRPDDFPAWRSDWEGPHATPMHAGVINGQGLRNVAITGRGTIDGAGRVWWDLHAAGTLRAERPRLIRLVDCRDVLIEGVTLVNSPMWTVNPLACDNVAITRLTIRNPADSPNTDGINPESCSNVRISDCHIDVGDDCIVIKAGTERDGRATLKACENITIVNCTMLRGHGGVVIGSEITGGIRNVAISNCIFNGTDRGIRIKARRGRGHAVEDVRVDNIVMDRVLCPIVVNLFYSCDVDDPRLVTDTRPHPVTEKTPVFRRLRFSNISAHRVRSAAAYVLGLPERGVEDVIFNNISVHLDPDCADAEPPAMSPITPALCRAGFRMKHVRGLQLRAVDVHHALGDAVVLEDVRHANIRDLSGDAGSVPRVSGESTEDVRVDSDIDVALNTGHPLGTTSGS